MFYTIRNFDKAMFIFLADLRSFEVIALCALVLLRFIYCTLLLSLRIFRAESCWKWSSLYFSVFLFFCVLTEYQFPRKIRGKRRFQGERRKQIKITFKLVTLRAGEDHKIHFSRVSLAESVARSIIPGGASQRLVVKRICTGCLHPKKATEALVFKLSCETIKQCALSLI